ncbi:MAG: hypothetical protein AAGI53_08195 [Planctomycetota bacterium]
MTITTAIALAALTGTAVASVPLDGANFDADYGAAIWSQNVGTQFGNNSDGSADFANGSELDALYAKIEGGVLYLGVAGNVETNFNKLNIVLDFKAGGQNTLNGLPNLGNLNGLTLDSGFEADAVLSYTAGNDPVDVFIDGALADGTGGFLGQGTAAGTSVTLGGAAVNFAHNNSNTGGVANLGEAFTSDPALVTTGVELSIDLAALGYVNGSEILIAGWINGSDNNFLSNQVIGGLPDGTGNLGGDGAGGFIGDLSGVDFNQFAGDQFVSFIPAPSSIALVGFAGLAAARRRR